MKASEALEWNEAIRDKAYDAMTEFGRELSDIENKALRLLELIESGDYVVVPSKFYVSEDDYKTIALEFQYEIDKSEYETTIEAAQQDEKIKEILHGST